MNNLETVIQRAKADIAKKYVFVHMPIPQLQTLLDGLEALQRELDEKDDAISYAMNQIQIKESHIRKIEAKLNYKSTIVGYSVELIEDLEKENSDLKKEIENANQ